MRKKAWNKNVVAIGLSSGFLEPLESTSIHIIQHGIAKLLQMFPDRNFDPVNERRYNRTSDFENEKIRDFIILHYHLNQRDDSQFWIDMREMSIPGYLEDKIDLFKANGRVFRENGELFNDTSWFSVMMGQNALPQTYDPVADVMSEEETKERLKSIIDTISTSATYIPAHSEFIKENCASEDFFKSNA